MNSFEYNPPKSDIHVIARALLIHQDKVILCRGKGSDYYFLPGGHVENGESATTALLRELGEEIGEYEYRITSFLGVCEQIFPLKDSGMQHEINLVFEVQAPDSFTVQSKENDIEFVAVEKSSFENQPILPENMKRGIIEWMKDGMVFFKEVEETI